MSETLALTPRTRRALRKTRPFDPTRGSWPIDGLEYLGACPVCGDVARHLMHAKLRDLAFHCAPGDWTLWRCEGCASGYLDPRPTARSIHLAYANYYTHDAEDVAMKAPASAAAWLRRLMSNGYRNWRYGSSFAPATPLGIPALLLFPKVRGRIDVEMRCLPRPGAGSDRRLLDVGCGSGAFLDRAADAGWRAFGCDPDPACVAHVRGRGHDVRLGGLEAWREMDRRFDAVTLSHVIEHVHNPTATLAAAWRALKPGGLLYIDTPNLDALGHEVFGPFWRGLEAPRHLTLFNRQGLRRLVEAVGFTKIKEVRRRGIFEDLAIQSAKMAGDQSPTPPTPNLLRRAEASREGSEFVTFTCERRG